MVNIVSKHEAVNQMIRIAAFPAMRAKVEHGEPFSFSKRVECCDVCPEVVHPIGIGRIVRRGPVRWRNVLVTDRMPFELCLIVNRVEPRHLTEEKR